MRRQHSYDETAQLQEDKANPQPTKHQTAPVSKPRASRPQPA